MKMKTIAATAALTLLTAGAAFAQEGGGPNSQIVAKLREACGADAQKFCPSKTGTELRSCMQENQDKLSDTCKAAIAEAMAAMQSAQKPN